MDNQSKHIKLHEGSMILLRGLENQLDQENIPSLIKDYQESGRLAGFGTFGSINELFVYEEDYEKALEILKSFLL
jgi:hypothetical protein